MYLYVCFIICTLVHRFYYNHFFFLLFLGVLQEFAAEKEEISNVHGEFSHTESLILLLSPNSFDKFSLFFCSHDFRVEVLFVC